VTAHRSGPPMPLGQVAAFQDACARYREAVDPNDPWANSRLAVAIQGALDAGWSARAIAAGLRIERKRIPRITSHSPVAAVKVTPPAASSELPAKVRAVFRGYEDEVSLRRINAERRWVPPSGQPAPPAGRTTSSPAWSRSPGNGCGPGRPGSRRPRRRRTRLDPYVRRPGPDPDPSAVEPLSDAEKERMWIGRTGPDRPQNRRRPPGHWSSSRRPWRHGKLPRSLRPDHRRHARHHLAGTGRRLRIRARGARARGQARLRQQWTSTVQYTRTDTSSWRRRLSRPPPGKRHHDHRRTR
jgi:hypothetical protein